MNRRFLFLLVLMVLFYRLPAQISNIRDQIVPGYNKGMDFFEKEKYPAAIRMFDLYLENHRGVDLNRDLNAEYFSAMASLRLFHPDAEYKMTRFIASWPGSERINEARIALGDHFYQGRNYRKAFQYYQRVNRILITGDKLPEYCFRYGYSAMMNGDKQTALLMFNEIKDVDTYYTSPALYYFSHLAYEDSRYETAYDGFVKLRNDETFGSVVPFYIVQILYFRKDYDGILQMAPDLLKSAGKQRAVELYRFIGDAHYNKGNFKEAADYLERYGAGAKASSREDRYQLGYSYYMTGEYDKAIKLLLELTARQDILSQNVWFILGDLYLKKGDKARAQFAFGQASQVNLDPSIKQEALFNYAKLLYENSYSPFGEAIRAFQDYIESYPGSDRIEEVYNLLVATFSQVRNYREALAALDRITRKDARLEEAYQKVAFFRGLELFRDMRFRESIDMFDKSLRYDKYNRTLRARAIYWRGEAHYRLGQYEKAIADYQAFMGIPGSMLLNEYKLVRYNLGYSYFNIKDYQSALVHFRTFESSAAGVSAEVLVDARNRIADCHFINTRYAEAVEFYNKVIEHGKIDADYALYQKGFAMGLMNNQKAKAESLSSLITLFPTSKHMPAALFERGRSYASLKDFRGAEADFNRVAELFPGSPFAPRAIVQLGLLYFDTEENLKAVAQFKKVIENYSSTPEARYALTGLRNAYVELNDVDSYFAYVKSLKGYADVNQSERDSLLYISGERLYMAGNCARATEIFSNYLKEFSYGSFRINALFYLAECYSSTGNRSEALKHYLQVIQMPASEFHEPSLSSAAAIAFGNEDYSRSFDLYEQLERAATKPDMLVSALRGQLRSAYEAGDARKTVNTAGKISKLQGIPDDLQRETAFMGGKAFLSLDMNDEALAEFRKVAGEITSLQGAESKYRVAEILFRKGSDAEAEKILEQFVSMNTPHQYWMAKAFILLSDISLKKGDVVMARATLQGLRDNYPVANDGILDETRKKLESIGARQ